MKNALFGLLVLIAGTSYATSLKTVNIRLQSVVTPLRNLHHSPLGSTPATVITLDSQGDVTGAKCIRQANTSLGVVRYSFTNCSNIQKLDHLSKLELNRMESLIAEAKDGEIQFPNPHEAHCLAIPNEGFNYTADNGKILLSTGTRPCGTNTFNNSNAAKDLIRTLRSFESKYQPLVQE